MHRSSPSPSPLALDVTASLSSIALPPSSPLALPPSLYIPHVMKALPPSFIPISYNPLTLPSSPPSPPSSLLPSSPPSPVLLRKHPIVANLNSRHSSPLI